MLVVYRHNQETLKRETSSFRCLCVYMCHGMYPLMCCDTYTGKNRKQVILSFYESTGSQETSHTVILYAAVRCVRLPWRAVLADAQHAQQNPVRHHSWPHCPACAAALNPPPPIHPKVPEALPTQRLYCSRAPYQCLC